MIYGSEWAPELKKSINLHFGGRKVLKSTQEKKLDQKKNSILGRKKLIKHLFIYSDPKIVREFQYADPVSEPIPDFASRLYPVNEDVNTKVPDDDDWVTMEWNCSAMEARFRKRIRSRHNLDVFD